MNWLDFESEGCGHSDTAYGHVSIILEAFLTYVRRSKRRGRMLVKLTTIHMLTGRHDTDV